ncbi:MAG: HD domain-containing protein [Eubacteriales bacterium]
MSDNWNQRQKAWELLSQHVKSERLIKHCLAVEAGMLTYARIYGEDQDRWAAIGLLHDVDYEEFPDTHPLASVKILSDNGYDQVFIDSIQSHATEAERSTREAKVLYAADEMCGFMVACALVRSPKGFEDMQVKSVMKKFKDKAFARAINRENAGIAAMDLGITLEEHIDNLIVGMRVREAELNSLNQSLL